MGQIANILDGVPLRRPKFASATLPTTAHLARPDTARLIPGIQRSFSPQNKLPSVRWDGSWSAPRAGSPSVDRGLQRLVPGTLRRFRPAMLGTAIFDIALILSLALLENLLLDPASHASSLKLPAVCFYLTAFFVFAFQDGLYGKSRRTLEAECITTLKIVFPATLFTIFALQCSATRSSSMPILILGWASLCVLVASKQARRAFRHADRGTRNVLIIGTGNLAHRTADAIRCDPHSGRSVKRCLMEHDFYDTNGITALGKIAREEFIDEVIVATHDPEVAGAAIREAQRNQLDVKVAAELFGYSSEAFGSMAGEPLLKIYQPHVPEWALAVKRIADVSLAAFGLVALLPLLLAVSIAIKLGSTGPVLYCAPRVGRRGKRFQCFKFRTMVARADAERESLRSRNERSGAFFKIANDPRITRAGRFLRRYSLDELPQLWSVLLGDMSLVGPRPHPPDDVQLYRVEHLRRLDFVPGITGLWQVTARPDPSFERSVALDVEYIESWSLWLDLCILWRTIPVVFQGSGA